MCRVNKRGPAEFRQEGGEKPSLFEFYPVLSSQDRMHTLRSDFDIFRAARRKDRRRREREDFQLVRAHRRMEILHPADRIMALL
uniref:Uncharacterized protein n=1 Tax=Peronospora matthiolae TaxID=2874970 RepID=A0AAV1VLF1_9STRA